MAQRFENITISKIAIGLVVLFVSAFYFSVKPAQAQGCAISEFTMSPSGPYTLGTHVQLHVKSNCGTVRFEIDGQAKAEIGSSEQWETWKTEEFGTGNHEVCAIARGDGGWGNANRQCRTVYVEGSQAPPSGSTQGDNVRCWVTSFVVTPGSGPVGTRFNLSSQGQCDGNMRAARYTIDGKDFGEHSTNTHNTDWNSSGYSTGRHSLCFLVTAGDWDDAAESCVSINIKSSGSPSTDVAEGEQSTNGNPGQTEDSNPSDVGHPQGNPPISGGDSSPQCSGTALSFSVGTTAKVLPGPANNLRRNPDTSSSRIGSIPSSATFTITGGPVCQDSYWWWEVSYEGKSGWTAQGSGSTRWIQAVWAQNADPSPSSQENNSGDSSSTSSCPSRTPPISVGGRGEILPGSSNNLRSDPGYGSDIIGSIPSGERFSVLGGPVCIDNTWWWNVRYDEESGWTAEGNGDEQWLTTAGQESSEGASLCEASVGVHFRPSRGGFVIEIPKYVHEPYQIYFLNSKVPNTDKGVKHDGFAGDTSETFFLGVSTEYTLTRALVPLFDAAWRVIYTCQ